MGSPHGVQWQSFFLGTVAKNLYQVRNDAGNANTLLVDFSAKSYNVSVQNNSLTSLFLYWLKTKVLFVLQLLRKQCPGFCVL